MRVRALLSTLLIAALAWAPAQSLHDLAPDASIVVLELAPDAGVPAGLVDALGALGWDQALETLVRVATLVGADLTDLAGGDGMVDEIVGELEATCGPGAFDLDGLEASDLLLEGVLTVAVSPFAPMPQLMALARAGDLGRATALHDALVDCFGEIEFEQDGVALHVLFDGSDLPLVIARVGDVFVAATDPDIVRGVVRRSLGAVEPSLATSPLGQAMARLAPGGVGFGLDFGSLADVVDALAGTMPPDAAPLVARATATLQTLGVVAGRAGWDASGLRFEQVQVSASPAPDAELARILTDARTAGTPPRWPAGTVSTSSTAVPLRAVVDYLDGWLALLEEPLGMRLDVRGAAADFLGLDLDAALLDWVGESVHMAVLEPFGTDLRGWVQGPAQITVIPVRDEAAARAGLAELGAAVVQWIALINQMASDPFGPTGGDPAINALFGTDGYVVTEEMVNGLTVDRVRAGPTLDLGLAFVDGQLVIASPFRALRPYLATRAGGPSLTDDAAWRSALSGAAQGARDVQIADLSAFLRGLGDLAELGAQPLASLLQIALVEGLLPDPFDDPFGDPFGGSFGGFDDSALTPPSFGSDLSWRLSADLEALVAQPLSVGSLITENFVDDVTTRRYELLGVVPGMTVEVEMLADWDIDTYLYVIDGADGTVLFENDDAPNTDRSFVAFVAEPGVAYHVLATSWGGSDTGTFDLRIGERGGAVAVEPFATDAEDPFADEVEPDLPTFAELLAMTDVVPRALYLLADRSGLAVSTTTVEGNVVITRAHWPIR